MNKRSDAGWLVLWSIANLGAASAASAATVAAAPPDNLDEIVVTAEKRNSTVQDTSISMTALAGDQLISQGITSVQDIAAKVPGISVRTAGPGQTEYEMRGLSAGGGTAATVGFYLDETPLSAVRRPRSMAAPSSMPTCSI